MDSLKKEKQSLINKIFLIIVDALSVVLCSFLGLLMRFEMDVSHIPGPYVTAVERMVPAFIAATLFIFWGTKLYHTALAFCQLQRTCRDRCCRWRLPPFLRSSTVISLIMRCREAFLRFILSVCWPASASHGIRRSLYELW